MEPLVDVILILNIGTGMAPRLAAEEYAKNIGNSLSDRINAKHRGIEILSIACSGVVGCKVEIIPLKAILEGKFVLKESINLPEMEEVLSILQRFEKSAAEPDTGE